MKHFRTLLMTFAKIAISVGIIAWLLYSVLREPASRQAFVDLLARPKEWSLLVAAGVVFLAAVALTFVRWRVLVRAVGVDMSLADSMRLGFIGCMFNFLPTGAAGGDILKAWMLGKEKPGKRFAALASVIVDRIIGLYMLFLVAAAGVFLTGLWQMPNSGIHLVCRGLVWVTAASTAGIALVLVPGFLESPPVQAMTKLPKIGRAVGHLLEAITEYRAKRRALLLASVMALPVHMLMVTEIFLLACGFGFHQVPYRDFYAVYPLSGIAQVVPLPAGPAESGIVYLYKTVWLRDGGGNNADAQQAAEVARQEGTIIALAYRLGTCLVIPIGGAYYFLGARREVKEVIRDIEEDAESPAGQTAVSG